MAREWNIRAPNSEETPCAGAWCGKLFYPKNPWEKYCSAHCRKKAADRSNKKAVERMRRKNLPQRIRELRERGIAGTGKVSGHLRLLTEDGQVSRNVIAMSKLPLSEDPVFEYVRDDREEVLDFISHQDICYGKHVDLISNPNELQIALARLDMAVNNISPKRIAEAKRGVFDSESTVYGKTGHQNPRNFSRDGKRAEGKRRNELPAIQYSTTLIAKWKESGQKEDILHISRETAAIISKMESMIEEVRMIVQSHATGEPESD